MVYARMSTASLSSHIVVLPFRCVYIYISIYIYINLTGVVAQGGSNFLHAFQWVIQCCSKWHHRVSHSKGHTMHCQIVVCLWLMLEGRLSAHPPYAFKVCKFMGRFDFLFFLCTQWLHVVLVGFVRTRDQPCVVWLRTHPHNFYTLNYILHVSYMRMSCTFVLKNVLLKIQFYISPS